MYIVYLVIYCILYSCICILYITLNTHVYCISCYLSPILSSEYSYMSVEIRIRRSLYMSIEITIRRCLYMSIEIRICRSLSCVAEAIDNKITICMSIWILMYVVIKITRHMSICTYVHLHMSKDNNTHQYLYISTFTKVSLLKCLTH